MMDTETASSSGCSTVNAVIDQSASRPPSAPSVMNSEIGVLLKSTWLNKESGIGVERPLPAENFRRIYAKHTLLRVYVVLYGENSSRMSLL